MVAAKSRYYDYILLALFLLMFITITFFILSDAAWQYISPDGTFLWVAVLMAFLAMVSGIVFIYSLVHYTQLPNLRSLIIMFLGANVVILSFFFLVTHPSATQSILSGRARNRTVVSALGFLLTPGVLAGSVFGGNEISKKNRNIVALWGLLIQPLFSFSLLLTNDPLFHVTAPSGGLMGLTAFGWAITIVTSATGIVSLIRYMIEWYRTRDRIVFGSFLALILWIYSLVIYSVLEDPYQVAELLWISGIIGGFVLLSGAMIFTAIIEPHRALENIVHLRTKELNLANRESDLYLTMWVHKMGNFLQAITAYLEILIKKSANNEEYQRAAETALTLSEEITLFNRQVATLSEIKTDSKKELKRTNLDEALEKADAATRQMLPLAKFDITLNTRNDEIYVIADDKLDMIFTNLFVNEILSKEGHISILVEYEIDSSKTDILIESNGLNPSQIELDQLLTENIPEISTLNLRLFNIRLLVQKYRGSIEFERDESKNKNRYLISLPRPQ